MKIKDYVFATKVSEAYELASVIGESAYFLAGGTSTFFVSSRAAKTAIDINRLSIKGITKRGDYFRIGAGTTINELMKYQDSGWVLNRVAQRFVNQQVRNISTIGGNVSRIFYWCDFPVVLRVLEGNLKLTNSESQVLKISEVFYNLSTHKRAFGNSILEYIEIPQLKKSTGFGYIKESRTSSAFSAATVAAFVKVEKGVIEDIKIALGAVLPFPMRLFDIEKSLKGKNADCSIIEEIDFEKLNKYHFLPREGMSLEYCKHLLKIRISDVLCEAIREAVNTGGAK